jgi:hypothetical protein
MCEGRLSEQRDRGHNDAQDDSLTGSVCKLAVETRGIPERIAEMLASQITALHDAALVGPRIELKRKE